MADECDRARKLQQAEIDAAVTHRKTFPRLKYTGNCHHCEAPVGPKQLFCDRRLDSCADDFEREWERRQR